MNARISRKFTPIIAEFDTAFIIITHLSTDIGTTARDPLIVAGGHSIQYWSSLTLDMRKKSIGPGEPITKEEGVKIAVTVKKNHVVQDIFPYSRVEYYALFGQGIEVILTTLDQAVNQGVCKAGGAWIRWLDEKGNEIDKWNGKAKFREDMVANPDKFKKLSSMVYGVQELDESEIEAIKQDEEAMADMQRQEDALDRELESITL